MVNRNLFVILFDEFVRNAMFLTLPADWPIEKAVGVMIQSMNLQLEEGEEPMEEPDGFAFYDWGPSKLHGEVLIGEVPKPGVLMAIRRPPTMEAVGEAPAAGEAEPDLESDSYAVAWVLKRDAQTDTGTMGERTRRFLSSHDTDFEPHPIRRFDVFVSYASDDQELATEIADDLQKEGLSCFLASRSISSGELWAEEIREALLESRAAVLLLTPKSVESDWVMCEAGACWALEKPIIPAVLYVDVKTLPELISSRQARNVETARGRATLVADVKRMREFPADEVEG